MDIFEKVGKFLVEPSRGGILIPSVVNKALTLAANYKPAVAFRMAYKYALKNGLESTSAIYYAKGTRYLSAVLRKFGEQVFEEQCNLICTAGEEFEDSLVPGEAPWSFEEPDHRF